MKLSKISLCTVLGLLIQPVFAAVDKTEILPDPLTSGLQSQTLLHSLKTINIKKDEYKAPFVHDLKNRHKVRTLFVESQALPIVDIQLTFNAGSARDEETGKGLQGIASMAAQLMDEGTEKYTATQIAAVFEQTGAQFSATAHRDMFIIRLRVLSDRKKLEPALGMLMEIINHATFKNSSINLVLSNTQVGQKQLKENPSRMMNIRFYRALYGKHPYAEPVSGTNASIRKITPALLKQFRDQFLVTRNLNIAITGKLSPKEALKLSERITGNLKMGEKAQPLPPPEQHSDFDIQHIPYDSSQAYVMIGQLGTTRFDEDRLALEVANQMFGGSGFNSILMKELRVKRGYTYGAYSSFIFTQVHGIFSFNYSTRQDQLLDSIQVAHQALVSFVREPINKKQLEETKAGMLRAFPNSFRSNATINAQLGLMGFYNHPASYLTQYQQLLENISADDVQNAIRKHLHPDELTLVIVSKELNKDTLNQLLLKNLAPDSRMPSVPTESLPVLTAPQQPLQETVLPDETPHDGPA